MAPDVFDELISAWLDGTGDCEIRERIAQAVQSDPALARRLSQWIHLEQLVRGALPLPDAIRWGEFRTMLAARLGVTGNEP